MVLPLIVGVIVSLLVQLLKNKYGTKSPATLAIVLAASIIAAWGYTYLQSVGLWEVFLPILTTAGAFYTFIIARFED